MLQSLHERVGKLAHIAALDSTHDRHHATSVIRHPLKKAEVRSEAVNKVVGVDAWAQFTYVCSAL